MISSDYGRAAAEMLVRDAATDRQIWMTAVGMPMTATALMSANWDERISS